MYDIYLEERFLCFLFLFVSAFSRFILPFFGLSAFFSIRLLLSAFFHPHPPSVGIRSAYYRHPGGIGRYRPLIGGIQRLFSVKYLFKEANILQNFLLLEDRYFQMTVPFMDCAIFETLLINSLRFSEVYVFTLHSPGQFIFR